MKTSDIFSNYTLNNIKKYSLFFIYIIVNSLFVLKYGEKYGFPLLAVYIIAILGISLFYIKIELKDLFYKYIFWIGVISFFIFSIYLNYTVDGLSLNVDRWSAMEIGIKALLNGEYPYNIPDHMGRESSNLPMLIILGMPFYLIFGSVGFLQSFIFLFFSYLIIKIFNNYKQRLAVLILLFFSPSYLWEVYVKSDLFSNFIIVSGFVFLIWQNFIKEKKLKLEWASVLTALIFLTRLSVIIPIVLLLFKKFYNFTIKEKLRFASVFVIMISCILYLFFHNAESFDLIVKHNPFMIQGAKQPLFLSISYIILAFILSFKLKSFYDSIYWTGTLLFICVFVPFIIYLMEYGYNDIVNNSMFDLSFFNMSMPFVILGLVYGFFKNNHQKNVV
ncbi:hypothetical protein A0O34_03940 [Chryseobacterium glaciei]|uniref:Glycosyltransferase RgtA/B/C/D-like domain-containing protein n=1 Tax=Chryseobacterium glaciei TaxID=1685010 RepID=A0A172XSC5_9FLAO|nr:hypothetical protein [Chryseobacterium glaciei]ANF49742.1 hypothetical protein A0O34_03940 [Chryseobacterium glaciei]